MIGFTDITKEISFQKRYGIPAKDFGLIYARDEKPLPFQYESTESISSFVAKRVDSLESVIETTSLSTSLVISTGTTHICDGLTNYASNLDCGLHYFLVNNKYQSEYFYVLEDLTDGTANQDNIAISGLSFFNNEYTVPWRDKIGTPDLFFGMQYAENSVPLFFDYLASEAITSFKAVKINNLGNSVYEYNLSTSLISVSDHHICNGIIGYSQALQCGTYYFEVNGKYESDLWQVLELENDVWVLETGIWENGNTLWTSDGIWNTI